jgi:hypothetical protein
MELIVEEKDLCSKYNIAPKDTTIKVLRWSVAYVTKVNRSVKSWQELKSAYSVAFNMNRPATRGEWKSDETGIALSADGVGRFVRHNSNDGESL